MVVLGRRAPAPDPAATPLRMEAVPSRACAADRGGWACGFGRQEVPTGGFSWQARTSPAGPQTGRAVAVGVVASEEHGTPGALCCMRARSECLVGGWGAEASPPAACALLPAERGLPLSCETQVAGSGRTGRRPALVGPFLLHPSERTLFLCLTVDVTGS